MKITLENRDVTEAIARYVSKMRIFDTPQLRVVLNIDGNTVTADVYGHDPREEEESDV